MLRLIYVNVKKVHVKIPFIVVFINFLIKLKKTLLNFLFIYVYKIMLN